MNDKKRNGKFYTPDPATQLLCSWAIRSREDSVLEPSFGGCGFLVSARDQLKKLGAEAPHKHLFGCDLDSEAFDILERTLGCDYDRRNFALGDFLTLGSESFPRQRFSVLVGNPPYVSHHNMSLEQRERARIAAPPPAGLSAKASLWAYFVLHGNTFVEPGGRAAWLLPGSFLYSEYASAVRAELEKSFERCLAIELRERLFLTEGTEETTVIVLCDSRREIDNSNRMQYAFCNDLAAAEHSIREWEEDSFFGIGLNKKPRLLALPAEQQAVYEQLIGKQDTARFGNFVTCRIGVVTGCNRFFLLRPSEAHAHGLMPDDLTHVLGKFRECRGIALAPEDIPARIDSDERCLLVSSYQDRATAHSVERYLTTYPEENRGKNRTFQKRPLWHATDDRNCPDAFFPIMQNEGPRIVINLAGVNATNSVYRLYRTGDVDLRRVALAMLSTFSQLGAEIEGRSYGSGGLKMEPSDVIRIPLRVPNNLSDRQIERAFERVHSLLLTGNTSKARRTADELIFSGELREVSVLEAALNETRRRRQRNSTTQGH